MRVEDLLTRTGQFVMQIVRPKIPRSATKPDMVDDQTRGGCPVLEPVLE